MLRFFLKIIFTGGALYLAGQLFPDTLIITGGVQSFAIIIIAIVLLHALVRPILRFLTTPLRWITFGLFNIVINMSLLWIADALLASFEITNIWTLFWISLLVAIANTIV
jgi:putative membrane protein